VNELFKVEETGENEWTVFLNAVGVKNTMAIFYDKNLLNIFLKSIKVEEIK